MIVDDLIVFIASLSILFGIWQFIWIEVNTRGYLIKKLDNESFADFLFRYYKDDVVWRIRKKLRVKWFYNSKGFLKFLRLKGIILVLIGFTLLVLRLYLSFTDYRYILDWSI